MVKLKLLFIIGSFSDGGGTAHVLTTLVNNSDSEKYDITILEYTDCNLKKEPIHANIKLLPAIIKNRDPHTKALKILYSYYPKIIKQILNLNGYDIIIGWDGGFPTFIFPACITEKKIAWIHSGIDGLKPGELEYSLQKRAWHLADRIVAISNHPLSILKLNFPQFLDKTSIIYNGIDKEKIITMSSANIGYTANFKDDSLPLLCLVGRLDGTKNPTLAIQVLSHLIKNDCKCNLLFIGGGANKNELQQLIDNLNLNGYVLFAGFQTNPYPLIKKATLICLTSFSEGFPTVICEGMVLGKPFVTTPVAGASDELANNGKCGLVSNYEPTNYAECIKLILTDKNKYRKMSESCREHIKNYSVEASVENFDTLINSLHIKNVANKTEKPLACVLAQFAHACVFSGLYDIKLVKILFWKTKTIYNFCKLCYYILRAFCMIVLYPFLFINYLSFAVKLQKKYAR